MNVFCLFIILFILFLVVCWRRWYNKTITNSKDIHVFYINLDKDKDRLSKLEPELQKIFKKENIHRIPGVVHKIGLEGCRLAHIKANEIAINHNLEYYIIMEDDVKSLVNHNIVLEYINNSLNNIDIDLLLLEQGQNLEERIEMDRKNDNLYRIYGSGNNAGAYLCKRSFGKKLVEHWKNRENIHCDQSWQELWKENNVYFHRPQLFNQRAGESNQNDVDYREEVKPFDFDQFDRQLLLYSI